MVRNLARVYYYFVFVAMLLLAAVGLGILLYQVLRYTPLNSGGTVPSGTEMAQAVSFAIVFWVIAGLLGGVHYFLIRRDIATDPAAGSGPVRSFFLNAAEFGVGWNAIGFAVGALGNIGAAQNPADYYSSPFPVVPFLAVAIASYTFIAVVEVERRRTQAESGAAIVFQRLNFYAIQFVAGIYVLVALANAIGKTLQVTLFPATINTCQYIGPGDQQFCPGVNLLGPWFSALFTVALLAVYYLLVRNDTSSVLRQVQQLLSVAAGTVTLVIGAGILIALVVSTVLGTFTPDSTVQGELASAFPLVLAGVLVAAAYALLLRFEGAASPMGPTTTALSVEAVLAIVFSLPFWTGVFLTLVELVELVAKPGFVAHASDWEPPVTLLVLGAAYVPLGLVLRFQTRATGANGPRRAFVLALLAIGILTGAIGGAVALVTAVTAALGAPLDTSGEATRIGVALFLTGLALAGFYGWSVVSEHLLGRRSGQSAGDEQPTVPSAPALPQQPASVETILDELLSGQVTREQAAAQVREAVRAGR